MPQPPHQILADPKAGYALDPEKGWFSVIIPAAKTNLIANPSVEINTTGYAGTLATISRSVETQRRGGFSLKVVPTSNTTDGLIYGSTGYTITLTKGQKYTWSWDMYGEPGFDYRAYIVDASNNAVSRVYSFKTTGKWKRFYFRYREGVATAARRLVITKGFSANVRPFYVDGMQLETGEPTTYLDGDMRGFVRGQAAYAWAGTPHASISTRSGQTAAGGRVVSLKDLGLVVTAFVGLGMAPLHNNAVPFGYLDGAQYQNTAIDPRVFTIAGALEAENFSKLTATRRKLIDAFGPHRVAADQPLLIQYQYDDCTGREGEVLNLACNYRTGLEGNTNNLYQERVALQFEMFLPYIVNDGNQATSLNPVGSLTLAYALQRVNGIYGALAGGVGANNSVIAVARDRLHGRIYFGGDFTSFNGVACNRVCYLDLTTGVINAMGTGVNGQVYTLAVTPSGRVWVGGAFTTAGGSTSDGLAYWEDATGWTRFTNGTGSPTIKSIAVAPDNMIYIGGNFTSWDGSAAKSYGMRYDGTLFYALGSGMAGGEVRDINASIFGILMVGDFTTGNGIALGGVGFYDADNNTFIPIPGNTYGGVAFLDKIAFFDTDGGAAWYVSGNYTGAGGLAGADHLATVNSFSGWGYAYPPGSYPALPSSIFTISGGAYPLYFSTAAGIGRIDAPMAAPVFELPTGLDIAAITDPFYPGDDLYFGTTDSATIDGPGQTTINYTGSARAYPTLSIKGSGTLVSFENLTTGKRLDFADYAIQTGETITLVLEPTRLSFTSSVNGNIFSYILPGSDKAEMYLTPGTNVISIFVSNPAFFPILIWQPAYLSADQ